MGENMNKRLVYADHAATTQLCKEALEAMMMFAGNDFGNPSSLHSWSKVPRAAVCKAREAIARCIGAKPEEIFFTSGGTEADNWVVKGSGGSLMVSSYEHHAVLNAAKSEEARGRQIVYVKPNHDGIVTLKNLTKAWQDGVGLVSVMMVNNEIGAINPIKELAEEAHKRGALFHTDAVQAVGHIPIDVNELGVDLLSASAHKFNGPKGIGFLYKRESVKLANLIDGGQQESGQRAGTENVMSIAGMAAALEMHCKYLDIDKKHLDCLTRQLRDGIIKLVPDAKFWGEAAANRLPGFMSVALPGHEAEGVLHILDMKGIAVSSGAACDSKNTQISHVLKAIGVPKSLAKCTLRITLGAENNEEDVKAILTALKAIVRK